MRYVLTMILDTMPEGTDVTGMYHPETLGRLVDEGYVTVVDDTPVEGDVDEEGEDDGSEG